MEFRILNLVCDKTPQKKHRNPWYQAQHGVREKNNFHFSLIENLVFWRLGKKKQERSLASHHPPTSILTTGHRTWKRLRDPKKGPKNQKPRNLNDEIRTKSLGKKIDRLTREWERNPGSPQEMCALKVTRIWSPAAPPPHLYHQPVRRMECKQKRPRLLVKPREFHRGLGVLWVGGSRKKKKNRGQNFYNFLFEQVKK